MRSLSVVFLALLLGASGATVAAGKPAAHAVRSPASGHMLVAAANPLAAQAGMEVLKRGGSAVDAAVAIQSVLGLADARSLERRRAARS